MTKNEIFFCLDFYLLRSYMYNAFVWKMRDGPEISDIGSHIVSKKKLYYVNEIRCKFEK